MKCTPRKFPLIDLLHRTILTATLFHSFFIRKKIFCSKNIQYAYNFYGTDLYVNVLEAYLEPSPTSSVVPLWENHKKALL